MSTATRIPLMATRMIALVHRFTAQYGVTVTWQEQTEEINSRGAVIAVNNGPMKSARVLLLKEKFTTLKSFTEVFGLTQDYTRYILTLPNVDIKKDIIITDNHGMKWKLGIVDWFDVGGVSVAKQASLLEVV